MKMYNIKDLRKGGLTVGLMGGGERAHEIISPLSELKKLLNMEGKVTEGLYPYVIGEKILPGQIMTHLIK